MAKSPNAAEPAQKTCFVISPIGEDGGETRRHADKVLKHLVMKAVPPEFDIVRADKIADPGLITNQVIALIESAELVIADLTGQNPNVFYELALRHALRKPIIQIVKQGESIPFDIHAVRTVVYNIYDPDLLEIGQAQLAQFVQYVTAEGYIPESPFTVAIPAAGEQKVTEGEAANIILNEIQRLSIRMQNIESKISTNMSPDIRSNYNALRDYNELRGSVVDSNAEMSKIDKRILLSSEYKQYRKFLDQVLESRREE